MVVEGVFTEFPIIRAERLTLRKLSQDDTEKIFETFSNPRVMKCYGKFPMKERSEAQELINIFSKAFESSEAIRWGIELNSSKELIGTCGFHNWKKTHKRAEIGYELNEEAWGSGYMKEAVSAIIRYGFLEMELNRIEANVYPENTSSEELLKKLGFRFEGLLKEYAYFREKYQDLNMFSFLKKDYNRLYKEENR